MNKTLAVTYAVEQPIDIILPTDKSELIKKCIASTLKNEVSNSPYDCLYQPFDSKSVELILKHAADITTKGQLSALVVVGIGGSHLCIQAIEQLMRGIYHSTSTIPVYYADTVDADRLYAIQTIIKKVHAAKKKVVLLIISKSGNTLETMVNAEILLTEFKNSPLQESVVCITDKGSSLHAWANNQQIRTFFIPQHIGGRFSVFTPIGLLPLALLGLDIQDLCAGARAYDFQEDNAHKRAVALYHAIQKGLSIHDLFLFSADAHALGLWYRQLMAESIGKRFTTDGTFIGIGFTPTVSLGTADLHSVGQLYLTGAKNRITTFITILTNHSITVPNITLPMHSSMKSKSADHIMSSIAHATMQTYIQEGLEFMHIHLPEKSLFYVGQFMYMAMIETIYLAHLLSVNPFDQPEVERYKKATKDLL